MRLSPEQVTLAIVGSGPGGLSAAVTAAECGLSHVLLEKASHLSDTIYKYQKGKKVMAHPPRLPLLGNVPFAEGARETILRGWDNVGQKAQANFRLNAGVRKISGSAGSFLLDIADGSTVQAKQVVLAIGLQGNLRKLEVPGAERDWVQYQLDDPDEYHDERIVVVGAGDAGIENALALSRNNAVTLINRVADFTRAKPGNAADIERAVRTGAIRAYHNSMPVRIEDKLLVLDTPGGEVAVPCDRIIARVGAIPPRKFLEECGIKLPSTDPAAVPELSDTYECNVPGLYIIGALAGYTLIKQAINQGHELARRLAGQPVEPADEGLLRDTFAASFPGAPVRTVLDWVRARVPMLSGLTMLQLREAMLDSAIHRFERNQIVFERGDYTSSLWAVAEGAARVRLHDVTPGDGIVIPSGEFFGEIGFVSGRRRNATVEAAEPAVMVEIPRRTMRRLESSVAAIATELDRVALRRIVHTTLGPGRPIAEMEPLIAAATLKRYKAGEPMVTAGAPVDSLFILRTGSATVSAVENGSEAELGYLAAGEIFGERGFLAENSTRSATVSAAIASEAVRIEADTIRAAMTRIPELRTLFAKTMRGQIDRSARRVIAEERRAEPALHAQATAFMVAEGIGEATNAFFIEESLCTRCGNCESACAATHEGISRVNRDAGHSAVSILLPIVCRHCENPHCMSDCPPDAISRLASGEVVIDQHACIGCSNCANNCPYNAIKMVDPAQGHDNRNWLVKLMNGVGLPRPRSAKPHLVEGAHEKKAVKCDLCHGSQAGPACVNACPTGAAIRIDPETYMTWLREGRP